MHALVIAIGCCLLVQQPAESDPFKPRVVPSRRPPATIEPDLQAPTPATPESPNAKAPDAGPGIAPDPSAAEPAAPSGPLDGLDNPPPDSAAPAESAPSAAPAAEASQDLSPLGNVPRQRLRPPELLAEALATTGEGALEGSPLPLVQALSRSSDRRQQLTIAQAYWRLSSAQAAYHWALAAQASLERLIGPQGDSPGIASARAAAAADVGDAQLDVARAQQELGDLVGMNTLGLPLCVDRPHVGNYNTLFEQIFGNRPAPPRMRLIHRTLPIRRKSIDAHGQAIVAALDALEATGEELQANANSLPDVLAACEQVKRERQAFLDAVRDYNADIAEYLFAVARPGTTDQVLVSQLILTQDRPPTNPAAPSTAPPAVGAPPATEPTAPGQPPTSTFEQPTEAAPPAGEPAATQPTTTNYAQEAIESLGNDGLYKALMELQPPARVQKLSELLHWDRGAAAGENQPIALADCLQGVAPSGWLALTTTYWQTRERAARHQILNDQSEQLSALSTAAINAFRDQGMAGAGVRLQAARRAAAATVFDAELALVQAQFELTQGAGRRLEDPWLLPITPPQSGRYIAAAQLRGPARHWADVVGLQHAELEQRADAVIRADELRAGVARETPAADVSDSPLDRVLWAITRQTDQTLAFLGDLTEYNIAIANYAITTSPAGIVSDELVKKLVIERTARGDT